MACTLLVLFVVPAGLTAFYLWRLRPMEIFWWSLNGLILATLTLAAWSAVLQIAWQERDNDSAASPDEPAAPLRRPRYRIYFASLFTMLALLATTGLVAWGIYQGPLVFEIISSHQALDQDRLARLDARLPDLVPPTLERRFEVSAHVARSCIKAGGESQSDQPLTWYCAKFAPLVKHDLLGKSSSDKAMVLIDEIRSGNKREVESLIEAGLDVNAPDPKSGQTPLDEASRCGEPAIIELLKQNGGRRSPDN